MFLLTCGTEEPALWAEALLPKASRSCGNLAWTWEMLLIKGFPLELFAFGLAEAIFSGAQNRPLGESRPILKLSRDPWIGLTCCL